MSAGDLLPGFNGSSADVTRGSNMMNSEPLLCSAYSLSSGRNLPQGSSITCECSTQPTEMILACWKWRGVVSIMTSVREVGTLTTPGKTKSVLRMAGVRSMNVAFDVNRGNGRDYTHCAIFRAQAAVMDKSRCGLECHLASLYSTHTD